MSMKNCLYDKALHATIKECKCKPSFYVLGAVYKNVTTCIGEQLDCAFEIFDNVESPKRIKSGTAGIKCQQPCNDQLYNTRFVKKLISNNQLTKSIQKHKACGRISFFIFFQQDYICPLSKSSYVWKTFKRR